MCYFSIQLREYDPRADHVALAFLWSAPAPVESLNLAIVNTQHPRRH